MEGWTDEFLSVNFVGCDLQVLWDYFWIFLKIPRFMRALDATIIIVLENVILLFFEKKCYIAKTVVF